MGVGADAVDAVADVVETTGNAVSDGLVAAGRAARLGGPARWLGGVLSGATGIASAVVKGAGGILGGVLAGVVRVLAGVVSLDRRQVGKGLVEIGSSVGGALIVVGGIAVALLHRLVGAEASARPLTAEEHDRLAKVFAGSVALYNVRIVEGRSGLFGANRRPFTLGNTIYMKRTEPDRCADVLVHELVHVWQYQHLGVRYTVDALGAQARYGEKGRGAYDWEAELARGRDAWVDLNKEAQGRFVQDVWRSGTLQTDPGSRTGDGAFFEVPAATPPTVEFRFGSDDTDHTPMALAARDALQGRRSLRPSGRLRRGR